MAETKYRYRIPPCPEYDIPAMESWLEDQASRGLHLSKDGFFGPLTTFEEGPPKKERFRLEPTDRKGGLFSEEYDPEDEAVRMLHQMGWTYRARRGQFFVYSTDDPQAPELNTDPQVQAMTMAALSKYLWKTLRSTLILFLFYTLLHFGDWLISGAILLRTWWVALLGVLLLWDLGRDIIELMVLRRYRRQLQNGEPLPHRADHRRRSITYLAGNAVRKALWAVLGITFAVYLLPIMTDMCYVKLEDYHKPFPFATLEDLYPGSEVDRMDGILHSHVYEWEDLLAPENYDFKEYADVTLDGESLHCYLTVRYHRTRWEWTARKLAREMVSQDGGNAFDQTAAKIFHNEPVEVTELAIPDADYCAYYCKNMPDPYLIIQKDDVVLKVNLDILGAAGPEPEALARLILSQIQ